MQKFIILCWSLFFCIPLTAKTSLLLPESKLQGIELGESKGPIDTLAPSWEGPLSLCWSAAYRIGFEATQLTPPAPCSVIQLVHGVGAYVAGSSKQCSMFIWSDASSSPGARLYQARVTATVSEDTFTEFNRYSVNPPVYVAGTFWVGNYEWDNNLPSTSLDGTVTNPNKYSSDGTNWNNDSKEYLHAAVVKYLETGTPDISASPIPLVMVLDSGIVKYKSLPPAFPPPVLTEDDAKYWEDIVPGEIIIGYQNNIDVNKASLKTLEIAEKGIKLINKTLGDNLIVVKVEGGIPEEKAFIKKMKVKSNVKFAEPNRLWKIAGTPNDPYFSSDQWDKVAIKAPEAWDNGWGDFAITIGVIDEGVDYTHPDLTDRYGTTKGWDALNEDSDPKNNSIAESHGTHCSGIAAATINNGIGIAGVSNSHLYSLRYIDESGVGNTDDFCEAVQWCINNGINILSMSTAGGYSSAAEIKCQAAWDGGAILFAASGNDGLETVVYPAGYSSVIGVGAIIQGGTRWQYSNYGNHVELVAPGTTIPSTTPNNSYASWDGTSGACPQAAGGAALVWSANPSLANSEVRDILIQTAADISPTGWDKYTGYGLINLETAVDTALHAQPTPVDTGILTVHNNGSGNLYVTDITYDAYWIKFVGPKTFTVPPSDFQEVTVAVRAKLSTGFYYDTLQITSNDPDTNPYLIPIVLRVGTIGAEENSLTKPIKFMASPNPVTKFLSVSFNLPSSNHILLGLYDASGRLIKNLMDETMVAGNHISTINMDGLNSGIYFVSLKADGMNISRKITLIR